MYYDDDKLREINKMIKYVHTTRPNPSNKMFGELSFVYKFTIHVITKTKRQTDQRLRFKYLLSGAGYVPCSLFVSSRFPLVSYTAMAFVVETNLHRYLMPTQTKGVARRSRVNTLNSRMPS